MAGITEEKDYWNKIIHTGNKYWIIREGNSMDYVVMKNPLHLFDNGKPIAFFNAKSKEQAVQKGVMLAKKHGYKS